MVLLATGQDLDDKMSQIVPSAGFTPPFDYSNFADTFDLSLLPNDLPLSPSTHFYTQSPPPPSVPKILTSFHQTELGDPLGPDFHKLLSRESSPVLPQQQINSLYLEVPSTKNYHANSPSGALSPYSPNGSVSTCSSYYPNSPASFYSQSPRDEFFGVQHIKQETQTYIKQENYSSSECSFQTGEDLFHLLQSNLDKTTTIKQESTVDFSTLLDCEDQSYPSTLLTFASAEEAVQVKTQHQDHQLLREALNDTSFQKKFNIRPMDFGFFSGGVTKMEEDQEEKHILASCSEPLTNESMEPVLNLAIEQMKKDVDETCSTLGISPDPCKWSRNNVISWLQWTSREFCIPEPIADQWDIAGSALLCLSEEEFIRRSPEGGAMLHAQLEIWKAAFLEDISPMPWIPETASNASSGEISDDEEDDTSSKTDLTSTPDTSNSCPSNPATPKPSTPISTNKPPVTTTPTGSSSSHIHLWQFLKELLATSHLHGSCIRWLDRSRGIFKIEDSVKVARLWGKRKNRPAMNYDKLSRSIRQYYKKGIMKKTERSQRLVYQFCHPYCL